MDGFSTENRGRIVKWVAVNVAIPILLTGIFVAGFVLPLSGHDRPIAGFFRTFSPSHPIFPVFPMIILLLAVPVGLLMGSVVFKIMMLHGNRDIPEKWRRRAGLSLAGFVVTFSIVLPAEHIGKLEIEREQRVSERRQEAIVCADAGGAWVDGANLGLFGRSFCLQSGKVPEWAKE